MNRIKDIAFVIYILSLIPGDTFYGDLHMTQSFFLIPMVLLYVVQKKYKFNSQTIFPILFVVAIPTFYLIFNPIASIIEWYRIIGNIFLLVMIPDMYFNRREDFIVFTMTLIGIIPAIAFYLGFWELKLDYQLRMSFLRHDPNILSYNLLFAYIFTLYFFKFNNYGWLKKYSIILVISAFYGIPVLATLSRTALAVFILIFLLYIILAETKIKYKIFTLCLTAFIVTTVVIQFANNDLISAISVRINEVDNARTNFLEASLKVVENNFFTGVGLANFGDNQWRISNGFFMKQDGQIVQTASHNGLLDIVMIGGIFFFLPIIYLLLYPALKVYMRKYGIRKREISMDYFLTFTVFITFIIINLTYSSYMSKTAWTSVALLYILTNRYTRSRHIEKNYSNEKA